MKTPFRNATLRREYEAALLAFSVGHPSLFLPSGERRRSPDLGSSFATYFWGGFDGLTDGIYRMDADSKRRVCYAYYRAGADLRRKEVRINGLRGTVERFVPDLRDFEVTTIRLTIFADTEIPTIVWVGQMNDSEGALDRLLRFARSQVRDELARRKVKTESATV